MKTLKFSAMLDVIEPFDFMSNNLESLSSYFSTLGKIVLKKIKICMYVS